MSGGLFARALLRETGAPVDAEQADRLQQRHEDAFTNYAQGVRPLPGGYGREELERAGALRVYQDPADLLDHLDEIGVRDA